MFDDPLLGFVLLAAAALFGYNLLAGWRTGIVRIPIVLISEQKFERDENQRDYWAVMIVNLLCTVAAVIAASLVFARAGA